MTFQSKAKEILQLHWNDAAKMSGGAYANEPSLNADEALKALTLAFKEEVEQIIGSTIPVKSVKDVTNQRELIKDHHKAIAVNELLYKQRARLNKTIEEIK